MKRIVIIVIYSLIGFFCFSQNKTLGIMDLISESGVSERDAVIFTNFIFSTTSLMSKSKYNIISRSRREMLLDKHKFTLSQSCGDVTLTCALEVGKYLSADLLIFGLFTKTGRLFHITLTLVNINTTEIDGSISINAPDLDKLAKNLHNGIEEMFGVRITSDGVTLSTSQETVPIQSESPDPVIGEFYEGGIVFYLDGQGGGLVSSSADLGRYNWNEAKILCSNIELNGYNDWFLPSKEELNLMYERLSKQVDNGFEGHYYWSSSEDSYNYAWYQKFDDGSQTNYLKSYIFQIRTVRAF